MHAAACTPTGRSTRLDAIYAALVDGLNAELAEWITAWAPGLPQEECTALAAVGVKCISGGRFETSRPGRQPIGHPAARRPKWSTAAATPGGGSRCVRGEKDVVDELAVGLVDGAGVVGSEVLDDQSLDRGKCQAGSS